MKIPGALGRLLPHGRTDAARRWGRVAAVAIGLIVVFGTYFAFAEFYRERGRMNADEGFYAVAARSVMEGKLPYRDFAYTQMPLLPYVNGLMMTLSGFGMDSQRRINVTWGALALLTAVAVLRRRLGRWEPALAAAWCVAASPHFASFHAMGKTYAAAGFFLTASFAAVLWGGPLFRRAILYAVFGTLAAGTRLSLALPVALALPALLIEAGTWRQRLAVAGISAAVPAAALLPFALAAPAAFFFFNVEYHAASVFVRRSVDQIVEFWRLSPAAILLSLAAVLGSAGLARRRLFTELFLSLAAFLGIATSAISESAYGEYAVPVVLAAATTATAAMWASGAMAQNPFRHVVWILPAIALLHPLPRLVTDSRPRGGDVADLVGAWVGMFTFEQSPPPAGSQRAAGSVEAAAAYIASEVPPGEVLAALPIVAVDAGRPVLPRTEMGQFSAMGPRDESRAKALNLTTLGELRAAVESREPVAIVKLRGNASWNFQWQSPSLSPQPAAVYSGFVKAIEENYSRAFSSGDIEVLVPGN